MNTGLRLQCHKCGRQAHGLSVRLDNNRRPIIYGVCPACSLLWAWDVMKSMEVLYAMAEVSENETVH